MNDIRFRLFVGGMWYYWGFISTKYGMTFVGLPSVNTETVSLDEMLKRSQQFIGLHDKNGKEMWGGDVVEWETPSQYPERDVIVFSDGMFTFKADGESVFNHIHCDHNVEVIGNIYEHPELLEGK